MHDGIKQCTKCEKFLPHTRFGIKSWTNKDGSKTTSRKSHCRDCVNKSNLERYHNNDKTKEAHRRAAHKHRIKSYGISYEDYNSMLEKQNYSCLICRSKPETLHVDHCHKTGKVRGLLCSTCNTALGHAKDDIEILKKMIEYLEVHNEE